MKNLIKKYNTKNTILVVSSYPDKKSGIENLNAVAWYAKKTFKNLARNGEYKLVVLAEIIKNPEIYQDGKILVIRAWRPNSLSLLKDIALWILRFDNVKNILLEFEFNMFGGMLGTLLFPAFLLGLRLLRKRVTLELHQVILDINQLWGHLGLKKGSLKSAFFNLALNDFYLIVCLLSSRVIVLEAELKRRLAQLVNTKKVAVLPIAVSKKAQPNARGVRRKLGIKKDEFVLLYFGFVNWYKGADWIVKTVAENRRKIGGKKLRLIVAGGESPTLREKSHYRKFYQKVLSRAGKSRRVEISGFVKDREIPTYFAACDLVVLPYRTFMSSSGPLSWALSFEKPFILSWALGDYFESGDFGRALLESGLKKEEVLFPLNSALFVKKLRNLDLARLEKFSAALAKERSAESLSKAYLAQLDHDYYLSHNLGPSGGKLRARKLALGLG